MPSLKAVATNTAPAYSITCTRDDGTAVNLTGATVTMKLYLGATQTNTVSGHDACTITDGASGVITWQPKSGDLPSAGSYKGDVKVTYGDATFEVLYGMVKIKARATLG